MNKTWPMVRLGNVLAHFTDYIEEPEPREYRKLSVKLYGKGVVLDAPADGTSLKMKRHQLAKAGQVILSEIWGKKGAIGFVPVAGDGALCASHFFLFDILEDELDRRWLKAIFDANYLQAQLDAEAKGTTGCAAGRPTNFLACEIPLPPMVEQRRLVARIEELAAGATIGATGILNFDSCFPDSIVGIEAIPGLTTPEFIYLAVEYSKKTALAEATQTTQPNINLGNLQRLKVPVPPLPAQRRIVAEMDALKAEVDTLKRLQAETAAEFDALLPAILDKAFKGEL